MGIGIYGGKAFTGPIVDAAEFAIEETAVLHLDLVTRANLFLSLVQY